MQTLGFKHYELTNHLGNVLSVVTDNINISPDSAFAKIVAATDYYAFGSEMPGRTYSGGDEEEAYRYGFNGKEKDTENTWGDTSYDYGFRIYNPRYGRFLSVDPLTKSYPMLTPYQFASNSPIQAIDLDGLEAQKVIKKASIYIGTLYEWGGKNPSDEFIGIQQNDDPESQKLVIELKDYLNLMKEVEPSYQKRILFPAMEKKLGWKKGTLQPGTQEYYTKFKKEAYSKLGLSDLLTSGRSIGLDCSGIVNLAYAEDNELIGGFKILGGSYNILSDASNSETAIRSNGELAAIIFESPLSLSQADVVWKKDHVMIATGVLEIDRSTGEVKAFEVIHQSGSKGGKKEMIEFKEGVFKFIHPFRTTDKGANTSEKWEYAIKERQWKKEK